MLLRAGAVVGVFPLCIIYLRDEEQVRMALVVLVEQETASSQGGRQRREQGQRSSARG